MTQAFDESVLLRFRKFWPVDVDGDGVGGAADGCNRGDARSNTWTPNKSAPSGVQVWWRVGAHGYREHRFKVKIDGVPPDVCYAATVGSVCGHNSGLACFTRGDLTVVDAEVRRLDDNHFVGYQVNRMVTGVSNRDFLGVFVTLPNEHAVLMTHDVALEAAIPPRSVVGSYTRGELFVYGVCFGTHPTCSDSAVAYFAESINPKGLLPAQLVNQDATTHRRAQAAGAIARRIRQLSLELEAQQVIINAHFSLPH